MSKVALISVELLLFAVIGLSFWYQDLRYSLPTPVPQGWRSLPMGSSMMKAASLASLPGGTAAVFNFYSCDCPCSRFNLDHVRHLITTYGTRMRFVLVMEGGTKSEEEEAFRGLNLNAEPYYDADGGLARKLAVYSTPQAVVVDSQHRLVYRGNYNLGRYCIDPKSEFVRLAIENVVSGQPLPGEALVAGPAYGCAISAVSGGWN